MPPRRGRIRLGLFSAIEPDMREVDRVLAETLKNQNPLVAGVTDYVLAASGKRVRPALVLLASRFGPSAEANRQRTVWVATAVEMIHMATLIHDDIIDEATLRRGLPAVRTRFSNPVAVLSGDFLFAQAFRLFARTRETEIVTLAAEVVDVMCAGEIAQHLDQGRVATASAYWQRIEAKTGFFLEASCRLGALASHAPEDVVGALAAYGHHLGLAFQVVDDLLDWMADPDKLGKAVGGDLAEGIYTLPIIYALDQPDYQGILQDILAKPYHPGILPQVRELLVQSGALEYSRRQAEGHIREALGKIGPLPPGEARNALEELAEFILAREF